MKKVRSTIRMYAGIFNFGGELLLRRRTEISPIIPGVSFKGNWGLPGGGGVMETEEKAVSYDYLMKELAREVKEELGIQISTHPMPPVYLTFFKSPEGYDLAGVTPIRTVQEPKKGETIYVSPQELEKLAREFIPANGEEGKDGRGLLGGHGKRMHCMALVAFCHSSNIRHRSDARVILKEIQEKWSNNF